MVPVPDDVRLSRSRRRLAYRPVYELVVPKGDAITAKENVSAEAPFKVVGPPTAIEVIPARSAHETVAGVISIHPITSTIAPSVVAPGVPEKEVIAARSVEVSHVHTPSCWWTDPARKEFPHDAPAPE